MAKLMRDSQISFLDVSKTGTTREWALINEGVSDLVMAKNPTVDEKHYIANKSATKTLTAIAPTITIAQDADGADKVYNYIDDLNFKDAIGSDLDTFYLVVDLNRKETGELTYEAKEYPVTIQVDDDGGTGGEQRVLNYTINMTGDAVLGTATIDAETRAVTFTKA